MTDEAIVVDEARDEAALVALLAVARGSHYMGDESFNLSRREVIALVRGIVAARPEVATDELVRLAGRCGIPTSTLVRVGLGKPLPPPRQTPTAWNARTRLGGSTT